ncbi:MAG: sterol desaturase family protein [Hyphomicrobiales bacterium]|nr:sterol desaturase family protein [Hyphomicrobiales bacterium]
MESLYNFAIFLAVFFFMEGMAWFTHKYVMHGFMWFLHESHHEPRHGMFELNDLFGVFFSFVAIGLIYWGWTGPSEALYAGLGVTAYGVVYFLVHDVLVHRRVALRINPKKGYFRRVYQAHRMHHAVEGKAGCVSFGFIFAPSAEHLRAELKRLAPLRTYGSRVDANRVANLEAN